MTSFDYSQAQDGKASTIKKTFSRQTAVSIRIKAAPATVWQLMTNAEDILNWNSTITELEGDIVVGQKIKLKSIVDPSRTFKLKVKSMESNSHMVWADGAAPFFSGKRNYTFTDNGDGTTTFTMDEKLGGLMFPMAAKSIPPFDDSFEQFAADLKAAAEK